MSSEQTFGGPSGANNSTIEYAETAVINGVNGKKVFPITLPPTAQTNPSFTTTSNATTSVVAMTIGVTTYNQTFTYTNGTLTAVSQWV